MTETRAPFNGKKKEPIGVFVRLHDGMLNEKQIAALCNPKRSSTENILAIGTPVTGGERDYEATVAHYEAKLAERDAEIAKLREYYQAGERIFYMGLLNATPKMFSRLEKARAALKGPEA
ncbi:hypothetical protein [Acetobacter pasteurianus]|uniref:Uncharacterized protein n=1 Tax=Acetobacter pasteurianus subsp. pasteurianus TaxID=481145 RepID=A0AAC9SRW3_ACEPA|nr:hypothetical protein [Acetobacter pasteurianus]ASC04997.1 hypothetical protein S101468_00730 [Acetobacter pasteurianus subsp. pasteurianus]